MSKSLFNGRGSKRNLANRFLRHERVVMHHEAIDEDEGPAGKTVFLEEHAKSLVNKVESPDVGMLYSMNPYQGCEHGCVYCYARNTHEYWGLSAGLDFEQKIIVKKNAPALLEAFLQKPNWKCEPLSLSGNTDCYQPAEQKFRITRRLLEICLEYKQPVTIITKNSYLKHDLDILTELAKHQLTMVMITITTLNETLKRAMEPRTASGLQRMKTIRLLNDAGVPCGVMMGPVIPSLNDSEMPEILEQAANNGATVAGYTFVRLNGSVKLNFHNWLHQYFPERAQKVWHQIEEGHGGQVSDSRFGVRMRGEGAIAGIIAQQFKKYCKRFNLNAQKPQLDCTQFCVPGSQLKLF